MNKTPKFTLRLIAAALALGVGLASPAFASGDDHGGSSHHGNGIDDHGGGSHHGNGIDDHGGGSHHGNGTDDHGGGSHHGNGTDNHGGGNGTTAGASLSGTVQSGAYGKLTLKQQTRATRFEAEVKIPVPATALAITDRAAAENATLTLTLSHADGTPYAECDFDLAKFKSRRSSGQSAGYKIEIKDRRGYLQERFGVCDIDLSTAGVQSGVPAAQAGDAAEVAIDTNGVVFLGGAF
jgi:hypothetical protein